MSVRYVSIPVTILREGKRFVVYTPALDLSTSGKTFEEARARFQEAAELFFEELERMGTLHDALMGLGWTKVERQWTPPVLVAQEQSEVRLPA